MEGCIDIEGAIMLRTYTWTDHYSLSSLLFPLLVSILSPTQADTSLHVFKHMPTGQAERGKTFYLFNVAQPTTAGDIFSNGEPSIALRNEREFYIIQNVETSDAVPLEISYFAAGNQQQGIITLGSLTTEISVIGKPKHTESYILCSIA